MDLLGVAEIAELLGVTTQRVDQLAGASSFPVPAAELEAGRIWQRTDIETWARATGRLGAAAYPETRTAKCVGGRMDGAVFDTDAAPGSTITPPGADDVLYEVTDIQLDGGYLALEYRGPA
jgi:hypothetical protein